MDSLESPLTSSTSPVCDEDEKDDMDEQGTTRTDVKSTAVVKFAQVDMPAQFHKLTPNTDLNKPPSNWLYGNSKWENYIRNVSMGKDHPFSSFKMAHTYPDLAGEIDIVTDSEILKTLLKIPYSKAPVSMMVHRVGNTLLLDEFDVHRHLLRKQADDWKWLRKFYQETVVQSMPSQEKQWVLKKNKSRHHLQQQNMFSKFLYYSVKQEDKEDLCSAAKHYSDNQSSLESYVTDAQNLPDPLPKPNSSDYQRTVVWNFEDLRMLIGTDLPIFGGGTHPCVSLRLQEMKKPISVLTGLDYWLDNLMCNVPELAMCYHLNGFVQSYELLKTEEIPNIPDSEFSPQVVTDIAQNILSFLKSKATKEGHTYWLFKGKDDDIVKLYDLTTLCEDVGEEERENPFSIPVAVLYYRVARNMRQRLGRQKSGLIRTLLSKCLSLLDQNAYPQVVTSAHYLMSDLYISDDIYNFEPPPESNEELDENEGGDCGDAGDHEQPSEQHDSESCASLSSVEVKALSYPDYVDKPQPKSELVRYPPVTGTVGKRSQEAIHHIANGLMCLDMSVTTKQKESPSAEHLEETQRECNPYEPIPLRYEPLKSEASNSSSQDYTQPHRMRTESNDISEDIDSDEDDLSREKRESPLDKNKQMTIFSPSNFLPSGTWHVLSKTLLLRKAAICFYAMAQSHINEQNYAQALKCAKLALNCFSAVERLLPDKAKDNYHVLSAIFGVCGDLHMMFSRDPSSVNITQSYDQFSDDEGIIIQSIHRELSPIDFDWVFDISSTPNVCFERAQRCYQNALDYGTKGKENVEFLHSIYKRMGNVLNEIGVFYMNRASKIASSADAGTRNAELVKSMWQKSETSFQDGISYFSKFDDVLNMALLHSNIGRLMRLSASAVKYIVGANQSKTECTLMERKYLKKSQHSYLGATNLLKERESHPEIWDSIQWELSTTYFNMATLLQDHAPLSAMAQEHVEKEVTDMMMRALKHCDAKTQGPKQPHCQYRAATIHHRLASLNHNSYRNELDQNKKKQFKEMAELHYSKSYEIFVLLEAPCEILRIQLERVALCEYQLGNLTSPTSKTNTLTKALGYIKDCALAMPVIAAQLEESKDAEHDDFAAEVNKLVSILESRLLFVLQQLVKCSASAKKKGKDNAGQLFKTMYANILKKSSSSNSETPLVDTCGIIDECLGMIQV